MELRFETAGWKELVSLWTQPKTAAELEGLIWNKASLSLPPDQRARGLRRPGFWWVLVTLAVLYFYVRYW